MAFIRTKRVGAHEYRQLVENYREDGRHRQRVLAHLGHHDTVADALEAARQKLTALEDSRLHRQYFETSRKEVAWESIIRHRYGEQLERYHGGEIPTLAEVERRMARDKEAPYTNEVERVFAGGAVLYKRAEIPMPPEAEEYCRAFGDGRAEAFESPNMSGHTHYYPAAGEFWRCIRNLQGWRDQAEAKGEEYNRRRARLTERIAKLEELNGVVTN
jgi:hypothetical protein